MLVLIDNKIVMKIKDLIYSMLTTSTGSALCDSGGAYGRHWERNQKKSLQDFESEPEIDIEPITNETDSSDIDFTVSLFHYLTSKLELDDMCEAFNALPCDDWDSDVYGISKEQEAWLLEKGFAIGESWNSYNGDSNLSQVIQGTNLKLDGCGEGDYVLLQIHQGCDVRGGYTDAKLVKLVEYQDFLNPCPQVYGTIDGIQVSTAWDGVTLKSDGENEEENGEVVPVNPKSIIELFMEE